MNPLKAAVNYFIMRASWLGEGGQPVPQALANARAAICLHCPNNQQMPLWERLTAIEASRLRRQIELKTQLHLAVPDEDDLHICSVCLCKLSLLIWCPDKRISETLNESDSYPSDCWKLACKNA